MSVFYARDRKCHHTAPLFLLLWIAKVMITKRQWSILRNITCWNDWSMSLFRDISRMQEFGSFCNHFAPQNIFSGTWIECGCHNLLSCTVPSPLNDTVLYLISVIRNNECVCRNLSRKTGMSGDSSRLSAVMSVLKKKNHYQAIDKMSKSFCDHISDWHCTTCKSFRA